MNPDDPRVTWRAEWEAYRPDIVRMVDLATELEKRGWDMFEAMAIAYRFINSIPNDGTLH